MDTRGLVLHWLYRGTGARLNRPLEPTDWNGAEVAAGAGGGAEHRGLERKKARKGVEAKYHCTGALILGMCISSFMNESIRI